MQDMEIAVKENEPLLTHINVNGTLPGQSSFIGVNDLTTVIKSFHVHLDDLTNAVGMPAVDARRWRSRNTEVIIRRHCW